MEKAELDCSELPVLKRNLEIARRNMESFESKNLDLWLGFCDIVRDIALAIFEIEIRKWKQVI